MNIKYRKKILWRR